MKILDFGLAKTEGPRAAEGDTRGVESPVTGEGMLLGTVGYMAPEQVRGEAADARSDLFALGIVLYEMLAGARPFQGASRVETLNAILKEEPPELVSGPARPPVPPALERTVRHCLEKDPGRRFQSAKDLAFALEQPGSGVVPSPLAVSAGGAWRRRGLLPLGAAALLAAGMLLAGAMRHTRRLPAFRLLTHEQGVLGDARFIPGSPEVLYSAQWAGGKQLWYEQRLDQAGSRVVQGGEGRFLAVAPGGEALGVRDLYLTHGAVPGPPLQPPAPGRRAAGVERQGLGGLCRSQERRHGGGVRGGTGFGFTLEWPLGHPLLTVSTTIRYPRIRGDLAAFFLEKGDTPENGLIQVVDRSGSARTLTTLEGVTGLSWSPGGGEVWVSVFRDGQSRFLAVDLKGRVRALFNHAERLEIQDTDTEGRILAVLHAYQRQTFGRGRGETRDHDLGWLEAQATMDITSDGSTVLLANLADWSKVDGSLYVRPMRGGLAQNIGEGTGQTTISPDGSWVLCNGRDHGSQLRMVPTHGGAPRVLPLDGFETDELRAELAPDGRTAYLWGRHKGGPKAFFSLDLDSGGLRPLSPPNCFPFANQKFLSPDGRWLAFAHSDGTSPDGSQACFVIRNDGTDYKPIPPLKRDEAIMGWASDSRSLYVFQRTGLPVNVERLELATGRRIPGVVFTPPDPAGISGIWSACVAPDAKSYAYNLSRKLSKLYLIEGVE